MKRLTFALRELSSRKVCVDYIIQINDLNIPSLNLPSQSSHFTPIINLSYQVPIDIPTVNIVLSVQNWEVNRCKLIA
jgi:hypothetical protein